jgi:hypothetical protein
VIHTDCLKKWILENNLPEDILTCPLAVHSHSQTSHVQNSHSQTSHVQNSHSQTSHVQNNEEKYPNVSFDNQDETFDESTFELVEQHMRNKYLSVKATQLNNTFANLHELINTLITTQNKFNDKVANMEFVHNHHHEHHHISQQSTNAPGDQANQEDQADQADQEDQTNDESEDEPDSEEDEPEDEPEDEQVNMHDKSEDEPTDYMQNMTRLNIIINTMTLIAVMPDNEICNLLLLVIVAYITYLNIDWISENVQMVEHE